MQGTDYMCYDVEFCIRFIIVLRAMHHVEL